MTQAAFCQAGLDPWRNGPLGPKKPLMDQEGAEEAEGKPLGLPGREPTGQGHRLAAELRRIRVGFGFIS